MSIKPKLIVVLGPNASGKSALAVLLAKKFNGEIISADSRQVYHGMNIGTGKINEKGRQGILHYLLDVASPKYRFTVAKYKKLTLAAIKKILKKDKVPIICGGTGFYIQTVVDNVSIPEVKPDWKLRSKLEKKNAQELFSELKKRDPNRARKIDRYNKRRLIRALEIVLKTGQAVPAHKTKPTLDILMIGIKKSPQELKKLIHKRLLARLRQGMIGEIKKLRHAGISWCRLEEFGLEYRWIARYLQEKISYQEMLFRLQKDIEHFAKRQMTWFKKDQRILWIKNQKQAQELIAKFLKS